MNPDTISVLLGCIAAGLMVIAYGIHGICRDLADARRDIDTLRASLKEASDRTDLELWALELGEGA